MFIGLRPNRNQKKLFKRKKERGQKPQSPTKPKYKPGKLF